MKQFLSIVEPLSVLLVPMIAGVTVYIAWQQYRLNRYRVKLDLFDRRLAVWVCVDRFVGRVNRDASCRVSDIRKLRQRTADARFLFEEEIPNHINDVIRHGAELRKWNNKKGHSAQPDYDHDAVVKGMDQEVRWFEKQIDETVTKFKKYLDMARL